MILELQLNEMNKNRKKKSKKKKNFPKDVTTTLNSAFYERYIPFMLFTSSMSQDELMLIYQQFCKAYFQQGSNKEKLPEQLKKEEFEELSNYLKMSHILGSSQSKFVLSEVQFHKHEGYNEKNLAGDDQEYIEFVMAAPYILVGFFCYVTDLIKRRRQ